MNLEWQIAYAGVEEDEVHLDEGEGEPQSGRYDHQNVSALIVRRHLEILAHRQTAVDHTADTEYWRHRSY